MCIRDRVEDDLVIALTVEAMLAQLGCTQEAAAEMATYLQHQPDADDAPLMRNELARWRQAD